MSEPSLQKRETTWEAFNSIDIRMCRIEEVTPILRNPKNPPGVDNPVKAYKLVINTGFDKRECVTNMVQYPPEYLFGMTLPCVLTLPTQTIRGGESKAMVIAVEGADERPVLLVAKDIVDAGLVVI